MVRHRTPAELVDMLPRLSVADAVYQRKVHAKRLGESTERGSGGSSSSHLAHVFNGQFRVPQLLAARLCSSAVDCAPRFTFERRNRSLWIRSAFRPHVSVVVLVSANKQVVRTDAFGNIAPVTQDHSARNLSDEQFPRISVGIGASSAQDFHNHASGRGLQHGVLTAHIEDSIASSSASRVNLVALPHPASGADVAQYVHPE